MLHISIPQLERLENTFRVELRPKIIKHWLDELREVGVRATPAGRESVLEKVESLSRGDTSLSMQDLAIFADLMLLAEADAR